ncbi:MAG: hypothetical protein ABIO70_19590 [Pseudomonadota bacterium]
MLLTILFAVTTALALTPPIGWSATGPNLATLIPADPGRGELRELRLPGASLAPEGLVAALAAEGTVATVLAREADGTVTLALGQDRIARARAQGGTAEVTWYLVQATRAASAQLDADALLAAIMPRTGPPLLQGAQIEVLPAGADGTLWDPTGAPAPAAPVLAGPWGATAEPSSPGWAPLAALVGVWGGTTTVMWGAERMVLSLDVDGHLRIEEHGADGTRLTEGTWGAGADQLRFAPLTGAPVLSGYSVDAQSLTFVWEGRTVTLLRRR